jgi:hypothetical protein
VPVDVPKTQTSLTQSCPADGQYNSNDVDITITGTLSGAPAGSTVDVEIKTPANDGPPGSGRTIVRHPTTNAQGNWSVTVASESNEYRDWQVKSSYAGTSKHAPASAGPCTFVVTDNS